MTDLPIDSTPWSGDQVTALAASIEHWYENWLDPVNAKCYSSYCPCCQQFMENVPNDCGDSDDEGTIARCHECPIAQYTGLALCAGTPWGPANEAVECLQDHHFLDTARPQDIVGVKAAIEREYGFLIGVMVCQAANPS